MPFSEAEQIVQTVRAEAAGRSGTCSRKDEGHGFQKKDNHDFYLAATSTFFQRFLVY